MLYFSFYLQNIGARPDCHPGLPTIWLEYDPLCSPHPDIQQTLQGADCRPVCQSLITLLCTGPAKYDAFLSQHIVIYSSLIVEI